MITDKILEGKNIYLRQIELSDCQDYYVDWLNDKEVNKYLESRWQEHNLDNLKEFVTTIRNSAHSYMFAIIYKNKHIGNIKIGPIHSIYKYADIGYFIGDKSAWGKGLVSEAISLVGDFAFNHIGLNKIKAGACEYNIGSQKALERNGFKKEYILKEEFFVSKGDAYIDTYCYGILRDEWQK